MKTEANDDVADLSARARAAFGWGATSRVHLHLVQLAGELKPLADAEARAALLDEPALLLERAGVVPGSWLLARVSLPAAAAGASREDGRGGRTMASARAFFRAALRSLSPPSPRSIAALLRLSSAQAALEWRQQARQQRLHPSRRLPLR